MFPLITTLIERSGASKLAKRLESDQRLMVLFAILCTIAVCFLATSLTDNLYSEIFRIVWICTSTFALILLYRSGVYAAELSSSRSLLTILAILAQLAGIQAILSLPNFVKILEHSDRIGHLFLLMPWMLAPGITSVLIGRRMGMFTALAVSMLGMALFPDSTGLTSLAAFMAISLLSGSVSATLCGRVHKREHILYAGFSIGIIIFVASLGMGLLHNGISALEHGVNFRWLGVELLLAVGASFFYAVIISGFMPILERIFNLCTPITWLELGDMNHKLLKELQLNAPGTFHHSLLVSRLAESAAESIGANPTHASVCALFHDIGKTKNPQFFAENISDDMVSPHDELTPEMSARIITGHVSNGIEVAQQHRLNSRIIDCIREHHGTSTAYFFYSKAIQRHTEDVQRFEEGQLDNQPSPVNKEDFAYKGPIPQTKESGIISMADAVESATRSLKSPSVDDIMSMIDNIFKGRILDGHLNESGLTLGELQIIKNSFFKTIKSIHHNRIAYPKPPEAQEVVEPLPPSSVPATAAEKKPAPAASPISDADSSSTPATP